VGPRRGWCWGIASSWPVARKHSLARALRVDKLALAALEASLALYADPARARAELPALAMLAASPEALRARADRLAAGLSSRVPGLQVAIVKGEGEVGGGSLPLQKLSGPVVAITHPGLSAARLEQLARTAEPPVIGTVRAGAYRLDPRTLAEDEVEMTVTALASVWLAGT
jgi:L-seryl-tRNA(Ser) seleniumtransferase